MVRMLGFGLAALLLSTGAGHAAECLMRIDGMAVAYDVPAGIGAPQGTVAETQADERRQNHLFGESGLPRTTPPGRPGMARLVDTGPVQPALPEHTGLNTSQRSQLIEILHRARAAEALGDEAACSGLLKQAQGIVAPHG